MRDLTIGNMRELAVRSLLVTCEPCRLGVVLTADDRPDLPLVVCTRCGILRPFSFRIARLGDTLMAKSICGLALTAATCVTFMISLVSAGAADPLVERGRYLVNFGGCFDCHTPGYFFGKPDMARYLGGSDVGFEIPGLGVFVGPNLTPDKETGLGTWTSEQIVTALQTGVRPDGRILAPIMPWRSFAKLTRDDAMAIAAFLKSLPPLKHKVPGPFGPNEKPTVFVMKVVPPESAPPK
jgi:mono/diheme cytochrome c family protein